MKILIADFEIAKYGGIIEHVTAKVKALKELGHEVDIVQITSSSTTQKRYESKLKKLESGEFFEGLSNNSQNGGYEKDEATGYWKNNYYGFFLPPSNRVGAFESNALQRWNDIVKDVDLIMWNFMPTKSSVWNKSNFDFWWKFFDLPTDRTKQIFIAHDAYFDVRASNISALKDKILFIECAHLAAYRCCANIGIPRVLMLNPRYFGDNTELEYHTPPEDRGVDFFAAHIFKPMKHVEDLIKAVKYLPSTSTTVIAGSGIEQAYMVAEGKCKPNYLVSPKTDPDAEDKDYGRKIWDVAEEHGMQYLGQISTEDVNLFLRNSKFAVDPSWASHYAQYCRTHINGFIIEAMLNGCYPVLRDYAGLCKGSEDVEDLLFENIRAVVIPHNSTPKQFAEALRNALSMPKDVYLEHTESNFNLVLDMFNAKTNMEDVLDLVRLSREEIYEVLECGEDSENVKRITKELMTDFFGIELPVRWETD